MTRGRKPWQVHGDARTARRRITDRERNPHILQEREWRKKAAVHLKMFKLEPSQGSIEGTRSDSERQQKSEMRDWTSPLGFLWWWPL